MKKIIYTILSALPLIYSIIHACIFIPMDLDILNTYFSMIAEYGFTAWVFEYIIYQILEIMQNSLAVVAALIFFIFVLYKNFDFFKNKLKQIQQKTNDKKQATKEKRKQAKIQRMEKQLKNLRNENDGQ